MEHLPPVLKPHSPLAARYLGGKWGSNHFTEFTIFLHNNGLSLGDIRDGTFGSHSKESVARLLQSWFYFGMLQEMLQIPIAISDFIRIDSSDSNAYVTTEKLRSYLARWKDQVDIEAKEPEILRRRNDRFIRCGRLTFDTWKELDEKFVDILGADIALSIHLLATCLEHAANSIVGIDIQDLPWRATRNPIVTNRLLRMGWCPTIVDQTEFNCKVALPYYLSLLGPPKDQRHLLEDGTAPGCKASDEGCKTKHVNNETFKPKHFDESCDGHCKFLGPDSEKVKEIVGNGGVPIVYLKTDGERPSIEVTELGGCVQYTAFSHVWADGRGNPKSNSLPSCQLNKLVEYMKGCPWTRASKVEEEPKESNIWVSYKAPPNEQTFTSEEMAKQPLYFWFDTLCIPIEPLEIRIKAIESMKYIYRRANRVIVLDAELLATKGMPESEEVLTRIATSHWIRRLWTLQEAVLGKIVYYQFSDMAFKVEREHEKLDLKWFDNEVAYYAESFDFDWTTLVTSLPGVLRTKFVWSALESRCVSRIEDQPICVAILLDMDLTKLLSFPVEWRVRELWKMFKAIPAGLLCLPGDKLEEPGFTWALKSFVACSASANPTSHPAYMTPEGLSLTLHGFTFTSPMENSRSAVIAVQLEERTYYIRQNLRRNNKSWKGLDFTMMHLAVILGQEAPEAGSTEPPPLNAVLGALVEILERREDTLVVRYIRAVSVIGKGTDSDIYNSSPWSNLERMERNMVVGAVRTALFQKWIISTHA